MDRYAIMTNRIVADVMDSWDSAEALLKTMTEMLASSRVGDEEFRIGKVSSMLHELAGVLRIVPINDLLRHVPQDLAARFTWEVVDIKRLRQQYARKDTLLTERQMNVMIKNMLWKCEKEVKDLSAALLYQKDRIERSLSL